MANSIDQIAAINCAEMGTVKAQCVHAVATLVLTAASQRDLKEQQMILVCTGILASALGIEVTNAMEIIHAGAADLGVTL